MFKYTLLNGLILRIIVNKEMGDFIMFGERLKTLRKEKGWIIEDVAEKLNVGKSTYAGWENEYRKPDIPALKKLSDLYGVSVDYILGLTNERDIKKIECDASKYLEKKDLHWNGIPLTEQELKPIRQILEMIVRDKLPKKINDHL